MKELDNTEVKKRINTPTFCISINGEFISYTYIRKNACTSFKRLFKFYSPHDFKSAGGDLKGMARYHLVRERKEIEKIPSRIFVYRDPIERVVSVYNNKFIQKSGAVDIFKDYHRVTGLDPENCTFEDFVNGYISNIKSGVLIDAHLLPQAWHLLPIKYNCAIKLNEVKEDMSKILGENVGAKFFAKPVNSTSDGERINLDGASDIPAHKISYQYTKFNQIPSASSYITPSIASVLSEIYYEDFDMIERIS